MITRIRDVRRSRGLTLRQVADACLPPTTAQTIGRLETGTRTVSLGWLDRIAAALGTTAADLVALPAEVDLPVVATMSPHGAAAPRRAATVAPPRPAAGQVAIHVLASVGDYRGGDALWCDRLPPGDFAVALNRDLLVPCGNGGYLFGRLVRIAGGALHILPVAPGSRIRVADAPAWAAMPVRLVRNL